MVPVKNRTKEDEEEDVDDSNVFKEAEEDTAGETGFWKHNLAASGSGNFQVFPVLLLSRYEQFSTTFS